MMDMNNFHGRYDDPIVRASLNKKVYIRIMVGPLTADSHFYLDFSAPLFLQKVGNNPIAKRGVGATFFDFDKLHDHPKAKYRNLASVLTLIKIKKYEI
jgi:hypothetical protein